jgi:DNA-binding IclR family transcriptional regulator
MQNDLNPVDGVVDATRARSGLNSGLDILECLAGHSEPLTMTDIAGAIGLAKSSVNKLLSTLQERGLVRRLADQRYVIGIRAWEIGCRAGPVEFARLALPHMADLVGDICEGVSLGTLDVRHTVCLQLVEAANAVRVHSAIGDRTPVHCSSAGIAWLATLRDEEVVALLPDTLEQATAHSPANKAAVLAEVVRTRERGYAVMRGAWRAEVGGIAFAVTGSDRRTAAVLCVALPLSRMTDAWIAQVAPYVRQTALAIERDISAHAAPLSAATRRGRKPRAPQPASALAAS